MNRSVLKMLAVVVAMFLFVAGFMDNAQAQTPSISITKFTNGLDANLPPGPAIPAGSEVVWHYVVTNTGDTALANVAIVDDQGVSVTCPAISLEPGESMVCSATGTAIAGPYVNTGTVEANDPSGAFVSDFDISNYLGVAPLDSDGDGISDDLDQCLYSDMNASIIVDGCDAGVANGLFDSGCSMTDMIIQCGVGAKNHGKFVSCVSKLTNGWKKTKLISGSEKGKVQSCAAKADIP